MHACASGPRCASAATIRSMTNGETSIALPGKMTAMPHMKNYRHGWTQLDTDAEEKKLTQRRNGNSSFSSAPLRLCVRIALDYFYLCPSVSICVHLWQIAPTPRRGWRRRLRFL